MLLNVMDRFSIILIKIPMAFFVEMEKKNPKIRTKSQGSQDSQNNLENEEHVRGLTLLDFKTHYKGCVIKTLWYLHEVRPID